MGLCINYELRLPATTTEARAAARLKVLRDRALALRFEAVSTLVRLTAKELDGPWPIQSLRFNRLEDVVHVWASTSRDWLYRSVFGIADDTERHVPTPPGQPTTALGFAIAPGRGCEPAAFGLARLDEEDRPGSWFWYCSCKTQYASVLGDEHLLRCHTGLVTVLDHAKSLGIDVVVRDEGGYWESRDADALLGAVRQMNEIVAKFAGMFTDQARKAAMDSHGVQASIFKHPDFERLEGG